MNRKLLSISIASYNVEKYLDNTVLSLVSSKHLDDIEVLIVNDGSKDSTLEIAKKYESQYPNSVKVVDKPNGGWGSTFNASIKIAKGKYFKLLDGDDWYNTNELDKLIEQLDELDSDIILTDFSWNYEADGRIKRESFKYETDKELNVSLFDNLYMHSLTIKTKLLQDNKIELLEHCFYTDTEFNIKSMKVANTFIYLPLDVYQYRIGREGQSVSKSGYIKHAKEHEKVLKTILPIIHSDAKFDLVNKNHFVTLSIDQFYIYMQDKSFEDDFYNYKDYILSNYPQNIKKAKLYIKLAIKYKFFYSLFANIFAR